MIEHVRDGEQLIAIIVRAGYAGEGITFFTSDDFSQQLAYMNRPAGHVIEPHHHNPVPRQVQYTQEVLFVRSGRLRVDFYGAG